MMRIKDWFLYKNFNQNERYYIELAMCGNELLVIGETEKAYKFAAHTDLGTFTFWCPKSCIMTAEEIEAEREKAAAEAKAQEDRFAKYEQLKQFAKSKGIKLTGRMKKSTLLSKLSDEQYKEAMELGLI